jgi:hypothetical protein
MKTKVRGLLWTAAIAGVAPVGCNGQLFIDRYTGGGSPGSNDAGADSYAGDQGTGGSSGKVGAGATGSGAGPGDAGASGGTGGATSPSSDPDGGTCSARPKTCNEVRSATLRVPLGPEPGSGQEEFIRACLNDRCTTFSPGLRDGGGKSTGQIFIDNTEILVKATLTTTPEGRDLAVVFDTPFFGTNLRNGDEYSLRMETWGDGGPMTTSGVAKGRATYRSFVDGNGLSCVDVTLREVAPDAGSYPDPSPCLRSTPAAIGVELGLQNLPLDAKELVQFCFNDYCTSFVPSELFALESVQTWSHDHFSSDLRTTTLRLTTDPTGAQFVTATFNWEPSDAFLSNGDTYEARVSSTTGLDASVGIGPWITRSRRRASYRTVIENSGPCGDPVSCLDVTMTPVDD